MTNDRLDTHEAMLTRPRCQDCPGPATYGLVRTKHGTYLGTRVPHGARWCKTHGIAAAKRRNAPPAGVQEA